MKNMKKQDRHGVRTPADLERKYDLGGLGGSNIDMTKIRLEVADMLGDLTAEMQSNFNKRIESLETETDQKIADAVALYVKTSDFDVYKASVDAILLSYEQTLSTILQDIATATNERASITQAVDALSDEVEALSGEVDDLKGSSFDATSVESVEQTTTSTEDGGTNILTVTLSDGRSSEFSVRNGNKGSKGDIGDKGDKGDRGEQGVQGERGEQGEQGVQGLKGDKGDKGDRGESGVYVGGGEMPADCNVQIDVTADPSNHPSCILLPVGTDLDTVTGLNRYVSETVSGDNYAHCPTTSGTFHLLVESCGNEGQLLQRLTYSNKTKGKTWERVLYGGTWGEWVRVNDYGGTLLWEGVWYMNASHTVNLSEAVSKQKNGIVLVFSEYSGGELNTAFQTFFIPKMQVSMFPSGARYSFLLTTSKFGYVGTKDLTITDTQIVGSADNNTTGTGTAGITFTNNRFCLRHVIGV